MVQESYISKLILEYEGYKESDKLTKSREIQLGYLLSLYKSKDYRKLSEEEIENVLEELLYEF